LEAIPEQQHFIIIGGRNPMTIQQLILDLLPILVPYIVAHAFLVGAMLYHRLAVRLPANRQAILNGIASKAVAFVEQKYKTLDNAQKKMYAETGFYAFCKYFGIPAPDRDIVDAMIEAAVSELNREIGGATNATTVALPSPKS
jgi:hypothetical protein